jgi:hypothetical protein
METGTLGSVASGDLVRIAFDANGLRNLCENTTLGGAALERLRCRVERKTARVVAGYPLVAELTCTRDRALLRRQAQELQTLTRGRLLRLWEDRVGRRNSTERIRAGLAGFRTGSGSGHQLIGSALR